MVTAGGQIFRGELPGNLLGSVSYGVRSEDEYGNSGSSATSSYNGTTAAAIGGTYGTGTTSAGQGVEPGIAALSVAFPGTTLYVGGSDMPAGATWFLSLNSASSPPIPVPGLLTLNVGGINYDVVTGTADSAGCAVVPLPLSAGVPGGGSVFFQLFSLDGATNGDLLSSSKGLEVVIQ